MSNLDVLKQSKIAKWLNMHIKSQSYAATSLDQLLSSLVAWGRKLFVFLCFC